MLNEHLLFIQKNKTTPNSDGLINCLRQRQDRFVRRPEGHLSKLTGKLWARTLLFLLSDLQNEKHCTIYQISEPSLLPFTGTTLALSADALVPRFLLATETISS
jgi:hypothetical protein